MQSPKIMNDVELEEAFTALDDDYPADAGGQLVDADICADADSQTSSESKFAQVTNDEFLTAIFGNSFTVAQPLVCKKSGDPDTGGWRPNSWPCNTSLEDQNWYALPGLYRPDGGGVFRAKKELAVSVHAVNRRSYRQHYAQFQHWTLAICRMC